MGICTEIKVTLNRKYHRLSACERLNSDALSHGCLWSISYDMSREFLENTDLREFITFEIVDCELTMGFGATVQLLYLVFCSPKWK